MSKKLNTLEVGKTYLIKGYDSICEAYVDKITKTAYKLIMEKNDGTWYLNWIEQNKFNRNYEILELLNVKGKPTLANDLDKKSKSESCPICNGTGELPDKESTTNKKPCPKCWGTGNKII
jgi:hypothetical protein